MTLASLGFTSTIAQIILMRELVSTFYGNELLFGLVLMAWLAWVAAGAWGLARLATGPRLGRGTFAWGTVLAVIILSTQIALIRNLRNLLGVIPGAFVEFGPMVTALVLMLAPLCLLLGFLFTLGARLLVEAGGTAGQAYVWEGLGAATGGALFSFVLIHWLDPFQTAILIIAVNLNTVVTFRPAWPRFFSPGLFRLLLAASLGLLCLGLLPLARSLHQASLRWQWSDLIFAGDSPYGRLLIQRRDSQRIFFENGLLLFETEGVFPEEIAHFPLLAHPDPHTVLLIGGGVAGDLREILKHPGTTVTYVELDPLLIEAAQVYLSAEDAAVWHTPRVSLALTDGRLYLEQARAARRTFDVVILDLPEPSTGALNRFYTLEFFTTVRAILNPGGIFALGLPAAENYWSPELARRNGSVYYTLRAVFPEVLVLPGEHNFFLAADTSLEENPAVWVDRLARRGLETRWVTPDYINYLFTTDRFADVQQELAAQQGIQLNRDLTPICYYYDLALWLSRFYPNLHRAFRLNLAWIAIPLLLVVGLARWRRSWAVPLAIGGIGLAQMSLTVVILFAFQVLQGSIYAEVSLIITAFMAGLVLGGAVSNRLLARRSWSLSFPTSAPESTGNRERRLLIAVQAAILLYSALLRLLLRLPLPVPTLVFPGLALLAGSLAGMAFPLAVALTRGQAGRLAGRLYGADLAGGCLGALLGAVFLIPLLGLAQTCLAIALVSLAGLLALV